MAKTDPRIDAYIEAQATFAQPILLSIRGAVHRACPDAEETLRWSMPSFGYRGKILCQMAAFKAHASFGFWQGEAVLGEQRQSTAMGQFGRLTSVADLPPEAELIALIRRATALIEEGAVRPRGVRVAKPDMPVPDDVTAALALNPAAHSVFDHFPPGCRREYLEWIIEAKRLGTRSKRVAQAVEWMAEGKRRNWKYEKS